VLSNTFDTWLFLHEKRSTDATETRISTLI
jgi:hypothetical protein